MKTQWLVALTMLGVLAVGCGGPVQRDGGFGPLAQAGAGAGGFLQGVTNGLITGTQLDHEKRRLDLEERRLRLEEQAQKRAEELGAALLHKVYQRDLLECSIQAVPDGPYPIARVPVDQRTAAEQAAVAATVQAAVQAGEQRLTRCMTLRGWPTD